MDPLRRLALDLKLRVKQARTERFKAADSKRKNLLDELEERERAFKRLVWTSRKRRAMQQNNERIQEGRGHHSQRYYELEVVRIHEISSVTIYGCLL